MPVTNTSATGTEQNHVLEGLTVKGGTLLVNGTGQSSALNPDSTGALRVATGGLVLVNATGQTVALAADSGSNLTVAGAQVAAALPLPNVVSMGDPRLVSGVQTFTANSAYGQRVVIPRTGTLADLAIYIAVQSGNIDMGVFDATVTPRTPLFRLGTTACPAAATAWVTVASPNLAVTRGQILDLVIAVDNATASFARFGTAGSGMATFPSAAWIDAAAPDVNGAWTAATSFVLPTSITPAKSTTVPAVIGRLV